MRRYEHGRKTETRSIQTGVQLLLITIGVLLLVSGLVLAVSGSTVGGVIGSITDDSSESEPLTDTETKSTNGDGVDESGESDEADVDTGAEANGETDDVESDGEDAESDANGDEQEGADPDGSDDADDVGENGEETHTLTVFVVDHDGDPVDNATVEVETTNRTAAQDVDENGEATFQVENGEYAVSADADGYEDATADVEIAGDDEVLELALEGEPADGDATDEDEHLLTVIVENDDGDPIEGATVELEGVNPFGLFGYDEKAETDEDGEATFAVEDGEYELSAEADGYEDVTADVEIAGDDETIVLTLENEDD